jgi:crotonobetainyl-CoA:carnitine CoA-transferase CaiB-like acyl-CoA transferase
MVARDYTCGDPADKPGFAKQGVRGMTRPFEGIRIIDITHVLAGPFAAYQLAVLGADVIKVEHPDEPDQSREGGTDRELNRRNMGTSFPKGRTRSRSPSTSRSRPAVKF